ncbi:MAG: DUF4175 family protein [Candidatus Latescibacterota bacterium]
MRDADRHYASIRSRLCALRRRTVAVELATSAAWALVAGVGAAVLAAAIEALLFLDPPGRIALGAAVALTASGLFAYQVRQRVAGLFLRHGFALRLEARCPRLGQRLISALELWDQPSSRLYSPDLLAATVAGADQELQQVDWRTIPDLRAARRSRRWLAGSLAGLTVLAAASQPVASALGRCAHPLTPYVRDARTRIAIEPEDQEVIKDEDATVVARFAGERPRTARLRWQEESSAHWQEEEVVVDRADSLLHTFRRVQHPLALQVLAGDGRSPVHRIRLIDPPKVQHLRLRYEYPAYSGLPARVEEESAEIQALPGTQVDFEITASKAIAAAALVLDDSVRVPAQVEGRRARARLQVEQPGRYHVALLDGGGVANRDPIHYAIELVHDAVPEVTLVEPGGDADLPENMQVLVAAEARDDFGISRVELVHRVNDGEESRLPLSFAPGRQVQVSHVWDLSAADLLPEDRIHYRLEALDNDRVSGPKKGVTPEHVLRFPSLHELYEEVTQEQEESLSDLQDLAREGRDAARYLEQVQRELLRKPEMSWEEKKELESTLGRQAEQARAVEELAEELQRTAERMEANGLSSEEILQRLEEIRQLMEEVMSPQLREALAKLQEALESDDPRRIAEALREFNLDQQAFQERLERTIALLEQVRVEQQLEAAVRQAADLEQRQGQIDEALEREEDGGRLQAQEGSLQRDTERLHQDVDQLSGAMERFDPQTAADLAAQAQAMQQKRLSGRMAEMAERIPAAPSAARRLGEGLESDLGELSASMQHLQQRFVAGQKQVLAGQMRQAMRELLDLSQEQEDLRQSPGALPAVPREGAAEEQFALLQGLAGVAERLGEVGRKTLALERPLATTLGHALRSMSEAAQKLGEGDASGSAESQTAAMRHLNEAVLQLRQSLDNLARSSMPSSFAEAMQKMMGLSDQQTQLNQATQEVFALGQVPGQGDQQLMAEMRRLAATQRQIRQALEELRRTTPGSRGAQERVGGIEKEMEEVITDLEQRRLSQGTLHRQQRILQRMLDASRSIHTQGIDEEKRRSQSGEDRPYAGPGRLPQDLGQAEDRLREALRQAMQGPYPEEYRAVLRSYYELLYQDAHPIQGRAEEP